MYEWHVLYQIIDYPMNNNLQIHVIDRLNEGASITKSIMIGRRWTCQWKKENQQVIKQTHILPLT